MAKSTAPPVRYGNRLTRWLLKHRIEQVQGPETPESKSQQHPWWQVVCLTGVDYFSTLGYIPAIAAANAGALSPIATLLIVLLTLFGMLPMYRVVAAESPNGQGSVSMLERLLSFWKGKIFVLCLLGFVATAWVITITLSAADATAHIVENPFWPEGLRDHEVGITLVLLAILGAVFLRGFKEAIGIAVVVVAVFLLTNLVVVGVCLYSVFADPGNLASWQDALFTNYGNPLTMLGQSLLVFPLLALGLSGFETGVSMMPLVRGEDGDDPERPRGRIRNTRRMLTVAALIMSFYLITTSFVTAVLIPAEEFGPGGAAKDRAMAFLAHEYLGDGFGTVYDLSTIAILWFAGASAMAGLLNIVPRYLPRYGMAPEWGRAVRPLVLVYTAIALVVTIIFAADVEAQSGAYATGVLAMMVSAAFAVALSAWRRGSRGTGLAFGVLFLVFVYAFVANEIRRPDGIVISLFFIAAIVVVSLVSRVQRSTELRQERIEIDETAQIFLDEAARGGEIHIVAHRRRRTDDPSEYARKEREQREDNHIPASDPILFLEVDVEDASEFTDVLEVSGVEIGRYKVLRSVSSVVPNAIAAFLLHVRDTTGKTPHCYFGWTEGNPVVYLIRFMLFGEGDTAPVTHEVLREAEPDASRRPAIHVGGR
ncbi:amino acid transporter [Rubrobacter tropicus]|uniref:Amino acid transporter n=1 Tax=Rubrobacter tropicus TaxID=2653851 RepID=A0A6G8Q8P4_9ACTN|nr:amino acid permease [Rubrobacter tropicus]QIN82846.1 amino acid transporter [Rubrobacter tropicus]